MGPFIEDGKYKVLEVLQELEGYKSCLCIDVETNNHYRPLIFNIYEKEGDIRRYLPAFYSLDKNKFSDFVQVKSGRHKIIAIFEYHEGVNIQDFFRDNKTMDFEKRLTYATKLLQESLILDATVDFISLPCLELDNFVVSESSNAVMINFLIPPLRENTRTKGAQCATLLEAIFIKDRYVPEILWEFINAIRDNQGENIVSIFSKWKNLLPELLMEHQKLRKETWLGYLLRRLKQRWRRIKKPRFRRSF